METKTEKYLKNIINETIKSIIEEENSINSDVDNKSNEIFNTIVSRYKKKEKDNSLYQSEIDQYKTNDGYKYEISDKFLECKFRIYITFLNYNNSQTMEEGTGRNYPFSWGNSTFLPMNKNDNSIYIYCSCINGNYNRFELYDTIQHELQHMLKTIKNNRKLPNLNFINIARNYYNSKNDNQHKIGAVLYLTSEEEQDCFINGLFAQLKADFPTQDWQIINICENSEIYKIAEELLYFKTNYNNYLNNPEFIKEISKLEQDKRIDINRSSLRKRIDLILLRLEKKFKNMLKYYRKWCYSNGYRGEINCPQSLL